MPLLINTLFFAETSAIYNAKTPNITNLNSLVANQTPFFVTRVALLSKYQERDDSFLSEQGIVKCGELIYFFISLFIYLFTAIVYLFFAGLLLLPLLLLLLLLFLFCFLVSVVSRF